MEKFNQLHFLFSILLISFLYNFGYSQQNESLEIQLWQQVLDKYDLEGYNGKVQNFIDNKGWQEWEEWSNTMNSNVLINDAKNGYLEINRFYLKTAVGAFKDKNNEYTFLKNTVNHYFNRSLSSNRFLEDILPNNFGISDFISDTINTSSIGYTCFYIEAAIPRKSTDTHLNLKLVPFGLVNKGDILTYRFSEYKDDNLFLFNFINVMVKNLNEENTLSSLVEEKIEAISSKDKKIIDQFLKEDNQFEKIEDLSTLLKYLNSVYQLNSVVMCKSIVLGWDRDTSRFYVKSRIKNDHKTVTFKTFLENSEYYYAAQ
ncbi:hypothetical protein [Aureibaculum luteum]|uniref:hypothetical protein n=1 Tax=Aureibaculum luteum TaxID=1548456 RepID=UPI000E4A7AF8|nr:hypothetical protein [Aureibaculum luteum]